jgi:hypothetical protein
LGRGSGTARRLLNKSRMCGPISSAYCVFAITSERAHTRNGVPCAVRVPRDSSNPTKKATRYGDIGGVSSKRLHTQPCTPVLQHTVGTCISAHLSTLCFILTELLNTAVTERTANGRRDSESRGKYLDLKEGT